MADASSETKRVPLTDAQRAEQRILIREVLVSVSDLMRGMAQLFGLASNWVYDIDVCSDIFSIISTWLKIKSQISNGSGNMYELALSGQGVVTVDLVRMPVKLVFDSLEMLWAKVSKNSWPEQGASSSAAQVSTVWKMASGSHLSSISCFKHRGQEVLTGTKKWKYTDSKGKLIQKDISDIGFSANHAQLFAMVTYPPHVQSSNLECCGIGTVLWRVLENKKINAERKYRIRPQEVLRQMLSTYDFGEALYNEIITTEASETINNASALGQTFLTGGFKSKNRMNFPANVLVAGSVKLVGPWTISEDLEANLKALRFGPKDELPSLDVLNSKSETLVPSLKVVSKYTSYESVFAIRGDLTGKGGWSTYYDLRQHKLTMRCGSVNSAAQYVRYAIFGDYTTNLSVVEWAINGKADGAYKCFQRSDFGDDLKERASAKKVTFQLPEYTFCCKLVTGAVNAGDRSSKTQILPNPIYGGGFVLQECPEEFTAEIEALSRRSTSLPKRAKTATWPQLIGSMLDRQRHFSDNIDTYNFGTTQWFKVDATTGSYADPDGKETEAVQEVPRLALKLFN